MGSSRETLARRLPLEMKEHLGRFLNKTGQRGLGGGGQGIEMDLLTSPGYVQVGALPAPRPNDHMGFLSYMLKRAEQ